MNLITICTTLRTVRMWVDGYERAALRAYRRSPGEAIHFVERDHWYYYTND